MTVLLTGFEVFGGHGENPSEQIVRALDGEEVAGAQVVGRVLPVEFGRAGALVTRWMAELAPEWVICLGLAGNRKVVSLERVALNLMDAGIADNAGEQPEDEPIRADGPQVYWSTLPVKAIRDRLTAAGVPVELSYSAGTYVCNRLFYDLMHELNGRPGCRGGFVHVPPVTAALDLDALIRAVRGIVEVCSAG